MGEYIKFKAFDESDPANAHAPAQLPKCPFCKPQAPSGKLPPMTRVSDGELEMSGKTVRIARYRCAGTDDKPCGCVKTAR